MAPTSEAPPTNPEDLLPASDVAAAAPDAGVVPPGQSAHASGEPDTHGPPASAVSVGEGSADEAPAPAGADAGALLGDASGGDASGEDAAGDEDADEETESGPLRRCIVTRERGERGSMLRFVVAPDGTLVPDLLARLPGRGMWLSAQGDVVETARTRGAFPRAARRPVIVPPDLLASVQAGLALRVADLTGFARRAGQAVVGYAKAREWLQAGRVGLVLQASDGSPDECRRLLSGARDVPVATPLPAARLAVVFGRDHVVHVAIAPGRLAGQIALEARRLAGVMQSLGTVTLAKAGARRGDAGGQAKAAASGAARVDGPGVAIAGASARPVAGGRDDRAGMPACTRDQPTGTPVARQGGRTVR